MNTVQNAHQRIDTVHPTDVDIRSTDVSIRWRPFQVLNMLKTFYRIKRISPDIAGQGTQTPDEKRTWNVYERTRTDCKFCYPLDVRSRYPVMCD